jgi:hypothetical protein
MILHVPSMTNISYVYAPQNNTNIQWGVKMLVRVWISAVKRIKEW